MSAANLINISHGRRLLPRAKQHKSSANFAALQPQIKSQRNPLQTAGQRVTPRKTDHESGWKNGSGKEFASIVSGHPAPSSNGSARNARDVGGRLGRAAVRQTAPLPPQQTQTTKACTKTRAVELLQKLPAIQADASPKVKGGCHSSGSNSSRITPIFIPTQVSRQQTSSSRPPATTPAKVPPEPSAPVAPSNMMTVEMLEQEMLRSSLTATDSASRKSGAKKRLALKL